MVSMWLSSRTPGAQWLQSPSPSRPAHRSADPLVPQMLLGSWRAAIPAGPSWRPHAHRSRVGRTGPEVCQPDAPQPAGVRPLLHRDPKTPHLPRPVCESGGSLRALAPRTQGQGPSSWSDISSDQASSECPPPPHSQHTWAVGIQHVNTNWPRPLPNKPLNCKQTSIVSGTQPRPGAVTQQRSSRALCPAVSQVTGQMPGCPQLREAPRKSTFLEPSRCPAGQGQERALRKQTRFRWGYRCSSGKSGDSKVPAPSRVPAEKAQQENDVGYKQHKAKGPASSVLTQVI